VSDRACYVREAQPAARAPSQDGAAPDHALPRVH
jgi:hypothetical protein